MSVDRAIGSSSERITWVVTTLHGAEKQSRFPARIRALSIVILECINMFIKDPFIVGPPQPLTPQQEAQKKIGEEWEAAGKPSLEQRIADRNEAIAQHLKRAFEEK